MKFLLKLFALAAVVWLGGSVLYANQSVNTHYNAAKPRHTPDGFKNNYPHEANQSFWKWQWERLSQGTFAKAPEAGWASVLPSVKPDVTFIKNNRIERTMTWIGHATVLLQTSGVNIITDPVFSDRASPVQFAGPKRQVPLMMTIDELPAIDVVFISHNHYDHLDANTITEFSQRFPKAIYVVPLGFKPWLENQGVLTANIRELDWWDSVALDGLNYTLVPVQHWSKRTLTDTNRTLWGGIVIEDSSVPSHWGGGSSANEPVSATNAPLPAERRQTPWRFLHTGDTGYSQDFKDIGAKFPGGFDWAAIAIGAYEPRWFMKAQHVNPDEAVQIMQDIGARQALGIHWGTFVLTDEALDLPPKDLAVALTKYNIPPDRFHVFKNGEMRKL
jgi:N-acyl-phosphatidylethanolamine-hydrolysing phospholipase D